MTLAIFLNNKLISCDTILPVAMEVHARTGRQVLFFTTDKWTFDAIRENVVLWHAIHRIGRLILLGNKSGTRLSGWVAKSKGIALLAFLALKARFGRVSILHFRALHKPPFNLLARIAPDAVFFCESDSYGESELMRRIVEVGAPRSRDEQPPCSGTLLAFSSGWTWLSNPAAAHLPRAVFGQTRTRKIWLDYVRTVADQFHAEAFAKAGVPDADETIVFMLGYLGALPYMRHEDSTRTLLAETLDVLAELAGGRTIMLKPHLITDMHVVAAEVARLNARGVRTVVANLHPSVLAVRARLFIANYYSTTLADAWHMGVPTIEYTDYSDAALAVTGGGSMNPAYVAHFICRDRDRLTGTVRAVLAAPRRSPPKGETGDPAGVLSRLAAAGERVSA